ncbi:hypothetical protein FRC08_012203 [Ceratobasidium sp. 394]|nr:hypothetical protein FRC08_012203 [Ceratobasidium sp. 394]
MLAVVKRTPNLRRLAVMTPLYHNSTHLTPITLANLVHLVVPSLWLTGSPDGDGVSMFSQFPKGLTALYIRGRVGTDEANRVVAHCPALRYVTVRVFARVSMFELEKFARILVGGLKDLLSLELMVLSEQSDALSSKLRGEGEDMAESEAVSEKASVHVVNDEESEMELWMSESGSTRPTWAR